MDAEVNKWLATHSCRNLYKMGLLETYIFRFDCSDVPNSFRKKLEPAYRKGLKNILNIIEGNKEYERN